ncbi:MAG: T9SS type A sorting domain-containing protein [Candidatus Cloacimonetes bacterium]|nr:T9SS type A sorting domain-containing protein [Candidatus Cloacimonadota bacterium]
MRKIFLFVFLVTYAIIFADGVQPIGLGTETDPYLISSLDNLLWLSTTPDVWNDNANFLQTEDIDATATENWNGGDGFNPIGTSPYFTGRYSGNGHSILNLYIHKTNQNNSPIGMFMRADDSSILDLTLQDIHIFTNGNSSTGGLIGTALNCTITDCSSSGSVSGGCTGGLIGNANDCIIVNCFSDCTVHAEGQELQSGTWYNYGGGIVGSCRDSEISDCIFSGTATGFLAVCGGVLGLCGGNTVTSCSSTGTISGYGLIAFALNNESSFSYCTFSGALNCTPTNSFFGKDFEENSNNNCYFNYEEVVINGGHQFSSNALPNDLYTDWIANGMEVDNMDIDTYLNYDGSSYQLNSFDDLQKLLLFGTIPDIRFSLNANIDLSSNQNFYIPTLYADFYGNNNEISNLALNGNGTNGFFAYASGCTISDLQFTNADVIGGDRTGIVCGLLNDGNLSNITLNGGSVHGNNNTGGVVGSMTTSGAISGAILTNISVSGLDYTGALCGSIENCNVLNCYSYCNVTGRVEAYCNDFGMLAYNGGRLVGGMIGFALDSSIISSYHIGSVDGLTCCGGLVGLSSNCYVSNSFSMARVRGAFTIGGFIGGNEANSTVSNCYAMGSVVGVFYMDISNREIGGFAGNTITNSVIENSFTLATVITDGLGTVNQCGGFIGEVANGLIQNCVWNTDINTLNIGIGNDSGTVTNLIGATIQEMQTLSTYSDIGWDFLGETANGTEDIWTINPDLNNGYPYLVELEQSVGNEEEVIPTPELQTKLYNNFPNPFNPETTISFSVKKNDVALLKIYNIKGQVVQSYPKFATGEHKVIWQGVDKNNKSVASGVYFYRLESKTGSSTKKMMLIK